MKQIQVLDTLTINKIAAGEVVERPASVVKELIENSIDAGASAVTVEIKEGGMAFIRITDNGSGIAKEQVKTAFLRHATSKIKHMEDLLEVLSLGFRGEALASIAAVAQVEMITKPVQSVTGTRIEIHGGHVTTEQEVGCPEGTTLIVRNIFYNIPARRKFLKKPSSETALIGEIISRVALGHPSIAFKYISNGAVLFHTSGNNDLKTTIFHIYGKEVTQKILEVRSQQDNTIVHGWIGKPELHRSNRAYENILLNGRYIKSQLIQSAVEEAYKTRLPIGKFPVYILHIQIPPALIDVNVHPTKLEVRFYEEEKIYKQTYETVLQGMQQENLIPKVSWDAKKTPIFKPEPIQVRIPEPFENSKKQEIIKESVEVREQPIHLDTKKPEPIKHYEIKETPASFEHKVEILEEKKPETLFNHYKIIGQIFQTYWIVEQEGKMVLIDQHAAHERVLYEKFMAEYKSQTVHSQTLLQPHIVEVTIKEKQMIRDNLPMFEKLGFEVEEFGDTAYAVRAVPILFHGPAKGKVFLDIVDLLLDAPIENIYETRLDAIASIACKAAVKGMDKISLWEAKGLIESLMTLDNPYTCPHGRPISISMNKYELEKKFKRIQ